MLHFFPPVPGIVGSVCLILSVIGILWECWKSGCPQVANLNNRLVWCWIGFAGLIGISLLQVPPELLGESRHRFNSDLLKGSLFALMIFLYLTSVERARRVLSAGALACFLMLIHFVVSTVQVVATTGTFPFQRDYLFWMVTFFPFALAVYVAQSHWRWLALVAATGTFALAVITGFRGATLAMVVMLLIFVVLARMWRLLALGAGLAVLGVTMLYVWFPDQATYVLGKFQQTNASNRWGGHWLPVLDLSMQAPWMGYGYGHNVFRHHYGLEISNHPAWTPMWSEQLGPLPSAPHSIVFETLFSAGWPGLFVLFFLSGLVIQRLLPPIWQQRKALMTNYWLLLGLAVLVSFVGNYVFFYQFETPAWRTLPILIALAAVCSAALRVDGASSCVTDNLAAGK